MKMISTEKFRDNIDKNIKLKYGKSLNKATQYEKYYGVSKAIMDMFVDNWEQTEERYSTKRQAAYLSAEYLMGRVFSNNLVNLGLYDEVKQVINEIGLNINELEELEADAGLGNGGLGRLAACFMDSCATLNMPVKGYGIFYNFGLFEQYIENGFQKETIDHWLKYENPWYIRRETEAIIVSFKDFNLKAVPYDAPIIGYGTKNVNTLRLWQAEPIVDFDFNLFNEQDYPTAFKVKNEIENISRILYPNDSKIGGKTLRLRQQYFFVSASIQEMVNKYKKIYGNDFSHFHECYAIQLNDTHPVVAIPELMRILVDVEQVAWEEAWKIVSQTFAYTNHTILAEALEQWDITIFENILPRIVEIIRAIDIQFIDNLIIKGSTYSMIEKLRIVSNNKIKMAHMAICTSFSTNGVAQLHTDILKNQELNDWYKLYPERFNNKTNGITPRRWLALANPKLKDLITELLGDTSWLTNLDRLKELEKYADDTEVIEKFLAIKQENKTYLAEYLLKQENVVINDKSIFDIQVKRLHEYKRQFLNALYILDLYYRLKDNPNLEVVPHTFIFGAKAFPGYYMAKAVIKFINEISKLIDNDPVVSQKIKVVFVNNYNVTYAQKLIPAADLSVQISTAGKEASGTGNMKFMLNGALTFGTYDGANIEIVQEAGEENNYIFGARFEELMNIKDSYNPEHFYYNVEGLKRVLDSLINGTLNDDGTGMFRDLYNSLLKGCDWSRADQYFILKDFESYRATQQQVNECYKTRMLWVKKCWMNIANAGKFSSDRTILQYCDEIWKVEPAKID